MADDNYTRILDRADAFFRSVAKVQPHNLECGRGCSFCCYGLFAVGAADIAVIESQTGVFAFKDAWPAKRLGTKRLECVLTIRNGEIAYDRDGRAFPVWTSAGRYDRVP